MIFCPFCGNFFGFGFSNVYEMYLFLLDKGIWKCSECGQIIVSDKKILSHEEISILVEQEVNKRLKEKADANL